VKPPLNTRGADDFQTPPIALSPLIPFLKKNWTIWECACGKGLLVDELKNRGFSVIGTDIKNGFDFLGWKPEKFDCVVTNPPYSLKEKFLERCYELDKPFALLLPLTTFEGKKRQKLFKRYGVQVIFLDRRINFKIPSGQGSGSWFATAWFTWKLNLPSDLNFVELRASAEPLARFTKEGSVVK